MAAVPSIGRASAVEGRSAAPEAELTRELYERHGRHIFNYCLHQLGNREEAEDATQTTFMNAFRGIQRGVVPELESAWLFKIANNVILTRRRSSSRRRRVETPGDLDAIQDLLPSRERDADELIRLGDALSGMPEQQRRALLLREWQGLSYREIGEELGLSQPAVETLLFRARRSLAQGLTEPDARRRGLRGGLDLGSALAALKGLLAGGAAVKAAATAAVVAGSAVVATDPALHHRPAPAPRVAAPAVVAEKPKVVAAPVVAASAPVVRVSVPTSPRVAKTAAPARRAVHHVPVQRHAPVPVPAPEPAPPLAAAPPAVEAPQPEAPAPTPPPVAATPAPAPPPPAPTPQAQPPAAPPVVPAQKPEGRGGDKARGKQKEQPKLPERAPATATPPAPPADEHGRKHEDRRDDRGHGNGRGKGHDKDAVVEQPLAVVTPPADATVVPTVPTPPPPADAPAAAPPAPVPAADPAPAPAPFAEDVEAGDGRHRHGRGDDHGRGNGRHGRW